jgi:DNA-binding response OmpR family regulator
MNTRYSALVTRTEMKILFVEDNLNTGLAMKVMLELKGHAVDHVANVKSAHEKLSSNQYDLLISDLTLPDGSGYDVVAKAKVPAIALSGYSSGGDIDKAMQAGFKEYLTKPFKTEELLAAIAKVGG